jgi:NAD(P)-dependent dehydrogenase (short-subunit alcohol dehydrogenase family)
MIEHAVLVTGALAGIGRATAAPSAREGATVVISGRRDAQGEALTAERQGLGNNC